MDAATIMQILVESGSILAFWGKLPRLLQRDNRLALPPNTTYCIYLIESSLTTCILDVAPGLFKPELASLLILISIRLSLLFDLHTN
jgi:hypothetical protein